MLKPTNSAAEEIVYLRSVNKDIDSQIKVLRDRQSSNQESIRSFEEIATWEDVEDPQEIPIEIVNDLSPDSPDAPENSKVIENPIR